MRSGWRRRAAHTAHTLGAMQAAQSGLSDQSGQSDLSADLPRLAPAARTPESPASAQAAPSRQVSEPTGCGWFESSRTLREGADVREHQVLDPIVNDLPLSWWIEWAGLQADARRP